MSLPFFTAAAPRELINHLVSLGYASYGPQNHNTHDECIPFKVRVIPPNAHGQSTKSPEFNSYATTPNLFKVTSFVSPPNGIRHVPAIDTMQGFIKFCLEVLFKSDEFYSAFTKNVNAPVDFVYGCYQDSPRTTISSEIPAVANGQLPVGTEYQFELFIDNGNSISSLMQSDSSWFHTMHCLSQCQTAMLDLVIQIIFSRNRREAGINHASSNKKNSDASHCKSADAEAKSQLVVVSTSSQRDDSDSVFPSATDKSMFPKRLNFFQYLTQDSFEEEVSEQDIQNTNSSLEIEQDIKINDASPAIEPRNEPEPNKKATQRTAVEIRESKRLKVGADIPWSQLRFTQEPEFDYEEISQTSPCCNASATKESAQSDLGLQQGARQEVCSSTDEVPAELSPKTRNEPTAPDSRTAAFFPPRKNDRYHLERQHHSTNAPQKSEASSSASPYASHPNSQPASMFQTAGRKTAIEVSDQSILNASKILAAPTKAEVKRAPASFARKTNRITLASSKRNHATNITSYRKTNVINPNRQTQHTNNQRHHHSRVSTGASQSRPLSLSTFQTAGSRSTIRVSHESLARADAFFDDQTSQNQANSSAAEANAIAVGLPQNHAAQGPVQRGGPQRQHDAVAAATNNYLNNWNNQTPPSK